MLSSGIEKKSVNNKLLKYAGIHCHMQFSIAPGNIVEHHFCKHHLETQQHSFYNCKIICPVIQSIQTLFFLRR